MELPQIGIGLFGSFFNPGRERGHSASPCHQGSCDGGGKGYPIDENFPWLHQEIGKLRGSI